MMSAHETDPADIAQMVWNRLGLAVGSSGNAFRTPVLSSCDEHGSHSRIVVLRGADGEKRSVLAYTDRRSAKVRQIEGHPRVSWLFWDPGDRWQVRLEGDARIHADDALAEKEWEETGEANRRLYGGAPPGTSGPATDSSPREHFCVLRCVVERIDWLDLTVPGHRRVVRGWRDDVWDGREVAP